MGGSRQDRVAAAEGGGVKVCRLEYCANEMNALGLCNSHYSQQRKGKALTPIRAKAEDVLDVLVMDGGWLTAAGVHLVLGKGHEDTIKRMLVRFRDAGLVKSRVVELGSLGGKMNSRTEWKAL